MATVEAGEQGAERAVSLAWRGGFGRLWGAAVVSRFGDALRGAALPLLAVSLTDSPVLVSLVTACGFLPWLLFGLLGGAIADRVDQRRAMWAVDVARGVLMAAFAVAVWLGHATIGLLLALAFALTTLQTLFDNAATALLPSVVAPEALSRANARLMTGQEVMGRFVGAPLVPVALGLGVAVPYAADAVTYLAAAALVASLGGRAQAPQREPRAPGSTIRRDMAEGIGVLWRDRLLRALCVSTTLCNVGIGALIATLVLHVTGWLGAGDAGYAAVITVYGIGSVAGGLMAARVAERLGRGPTIMVCGIAQIAALLALGTIRELPAAVAAFGVFGLAGMVWNVTEVTMMQQRSPAEMLGRVSAAFRTLSTAGAPLGALLGGVIAGAWGLNTPALAAAALFACGLVALVPGMRSPIN
ncbi:antibiotic transport protein [Streptomyces bingchenggensis BCW-1]|uniref:Antibiotic transport protein n=1 Tax=Streptomyces bingchenggensis (strain BCW-1) TaxID=749414 RepID=D7CGS4_STRBB|nr:MULTISPECIES: MFS transporter [Streptomyces]ADI11154.1 antibiotic transport protein [Streptomyces bingchenggensis BCW-1]